MADALGQLRAAMSERGRDPKTLHIVPMGVIPNPEKLDHYRKLGVTEVVLRLPSGQRDTVLPKLDEFTQYL